MNSFAPIVAAFSVAFIVTRELLLRRKKRQEQDYVYNFAFSMVPQFQAVSQELVCVTLVEISNAYPELMPDAARCIRLFGMPLPRKVVFKGQTDSEELVDAETVFCDLVQRMQELRSKRPLF